jgi:hypothetical protein
VRGEPRPRTVGMLRERPTRDQSEGHRTGLLFRSWSEKARGRGPLVAQTSVGRSAQPCGGWATSESKIPANEAVQQGSLSRVVGPDSACHAGGRGFESRRSRSKYLQIGVFCCRTGRNRPPASRIPDPSRARTAEPSQARCPQTNGPSRDPANHGCRSAISDLRLRANRPHREELCMSADIRHRTSNRTGALGLKEETVR